MFLIFQTDSILLKPIEDEWFAYDYVGAPCRPNSYTNMGSLYAKWRSFSLRKQENIDRVFPKRMEKAQNPGNEDIWWCSQLSSSRSVNSGIKNAFTRESKRIFSSKVFFMQGPTGLHKPYES
jgi:hypothetical protein